MEFLWPFLNQQNLNNHNMAGLGLDPAMIAAAIQGLGQFCPGGLGGVAAAAASGASAGCSNNQDFGPCSSEQARARQDAEGQQQQRENNGSRFNLEEFMSTAAAVVTSLADQYRQAQESSGAGVGAAGPSAAGGRCQRQQCGTSQNNAKLTKDEFEVRFDVGQFKPEELNVKVVDNYIVLEGVHEEREEDQGFVSRQFKRRIAIPEGIDADKINCAFTPSGQLVISAPKLVKKPETGEKSIPIRVDNTNVTVNAEPATAAPTSAGNNGAEASAPAAEPMAR